MSIINRIYQFIDNKRISVNEFSNIVGVSNGYFAKQRSNNASIGSHIVEKIVIQYPELNLRWLFTGDGAMIAEPAEAMKVQCITNTPERKIDNQQIPLYDIEAAAGLVLINNGHSIPIDYISIPNLSPCDGAMQVRGESMMPRLQSGDIVVFKMVTNVQYIMWNEMYIISFEIDGDYYTLIKLIKKSKQSNHIQLVSINTEHEPIEIPIDAIRQLAQVKASIHYNSM